MCKIHNEISDQQIFYILYIRAYYKRKQEQIIGSLLMLVIIIKNVEIFLYFEPEKRSEKCCNGLVFLNYNIVFNKIQRKMCQRFFMWLF